MGLAVDDPGTNYPGQWPTEPKCLRAENQRPRATIQIQDCIYACKTYLSYPRTLDRLVQLRRLFQWRAS